MFWFCILLGVVTALCLYYITGRYNENYWKKRGVAFYTKNKVLGPIWEFLTGDKAIFEILYEDVYKKFPNEPAIGIGAIFTPTLYVRDIENVQHVLQTDFQSFHHRGFDIYEKDLLADNILFMNGHRWKLMRQGMTPLFTTSKLKDMYYILDKSAKDFVVYLKDDPSKLKTNMFDTISSFCSAAIGAAVFGIKTKSIFESPFLEMAVAALKPTIPFNIKFSLNAFWPKALQVLKLKLFPEYKDFFVGAIKQVIRQREQEGIKKHDFADTCVTLQKNGMLRDANTGYELEPTDELLAAQAFFFFAAGVEPTATAIFSAFVELGKNPEVLHKLHAEIDQVWEKYNGELSYEAVVEMEYLDMVLSEALRIYPPIGFLTRLCVRDTVLPVGNIKVSKGTKIFTPIFELHHDPKYYTDPEVFNPERFTQDNKDKRNNDILFQPFGKGPRLCIGVRYARMQAKAGMIHLLREFSPKTTIRKGGIKFSKQQVQVRPVNVDLEFVPRKLKDN